MITVGPQVEQLATAVAGLFDRDPHLAPDLELLNTTEELLRLRRQIDAVIASHLQVIDTRDASVSECGRQTRGWLVEELLLGTEDANRYLTVARALPARPAVGDALAAALISLDHARVIVTAVNKAPTEIRDVVEKELVKAAEVVDPSALARFARGLISRLSGDDIEAAALRKYESRWVRMSETFDGMHAIDGMLDPVSAATLKAAITPLLTKAGTEDSRTSGQRFADGLVSLAEHAMAAGGLPEHGGEKPQVIVTIGWEALKADLDAGLDDPGLLPVGIATMNGIDITPKTARMIACDAGIIPAVLGGASEVLDLGRKQPNWSPAQRRALRIEDGGCRWPGCQAGLDRCRIHHQDHWALGGPTKTSNGVHVCEFHHWLVHHTKWRIRKDKNNRITVWRQ